MKKIILLAAMLFVTVLSFSAVDNEFVLFSPLQTGGEDQDVKNLRLGILYSNNQNVSGVDANWLVSNAKSFNGTRVFGWLNMDEKGGRQHSFLNGVNYSKGNVKGNTIIAWASINNNHEGIRLAGVNFTKNKVKGKDIGYVNYTKKMIGIQIGLFNYAESLDGYQIGLLNYAKNSDIFMILPFFNMAGQK